MAHLDIHEVICTDASEFRVLGPTLVQHAANVVALLALHAKGNEGNTSERQSKARGGLGRTYHDTLSVAAAIPVRVCDLYLFLFDFLFTPQPFLSQTFALFALGLFAFSIGQEGRVDVGVLAELAALGGWRLVILVVVCRGGDGRRVGVAFVVHSEGECGLCHLFPFLQFLCVISKQILHIL